MTVKVHFSSLRSHLIGKCFSFNFKENYKGYQLLTNPTFFIKYATYKYPPGFCLKLFKQNVILVEYAFSLPCS